MNTGVLPPSLWCKGDQWGLMEQSPLQPAEPGHLTFAFKYLSVCVSLQRTFAHNEVIIQEGDEGRTFFFILRGQVGLTCLCGSQVL